MQAEARGGEPQDAHHPSQKTVAGTGTGSRDEDIQALKLLAEVVDKLQRLMVSKQQQPSLTSRLNEKIPLGNSAVSPKLTRTPPMPYPGPVSSSSSSSSSVSSREDNFCGQTQTVVRFDSVHRMSGGRRHECVRLSSGEPLEEQQDCGSPGCLSSRSSRNNI